MVFCMLVTFVSLLHLHLRLSLRHTLSILFYQEQSVRSFLIITAAAICQARSRILKQELFL